MSSDLAGLRERITAEFDAVVIGAGFSGLYAIYRLRKAGFSVKVLEAAPDIGGTWYFNRYPGARCDVESMSYSYSFDNELQQEWEWSERYAGQAEILRYINHVADRFDLRSDIQFNTLVTRAVFDEDAGRWLVETEAGEVFSGRFCLLASGCLSVPNKPQIEGLDDFEGDMYHTAFWPHEKVDFSGKRVGVIGTGSSGVQAIPLIAAEAEHVTVFQRTANYVVPAHNGPLKPEYVAEWKRHYPELRDRARYAVRIGQATVGFTPRVSAALEITPEEQREELERRWGHGGLMMWEPFTDVLRDERANEVVAEFVREKIREAVKDPELAEKLCPKGFPYGAKRLCVGTDYYETFNRDNISLVDLNEQPIERVMANGIRTTERDYEFDAIVLATGFDAMTGAILKMDLIGRGGATMREKWAAGPRTHMGIMMADFPNLFMITGPGSPAAFSNLVLSIEQHVEWVTDCLSYVRDKGCDRIEPTREAEDEWCDRLNERASKTLFPRANSWYMGANIPGKPRAFMVYLGGVGPYREHCEEVARDGYPGFAMGS